MSDCRISELKNTCPMKPRQTIDNLYLHVEDELMNLSKHHMDILSGAGSTIATS
jgi:hypothetical protein